MTNKQEIINVHTNHAICPSCGCFTWWDWYFVTESDPYDGKIDPFGGYYINNNKNKGFRIAATQCSSCKQICVFHDGKMIYPKANVHIKPHELFNDYPKSKKLFEESLAVASASPRAALTLSRMCLESLVNEILEQLNETPNEKN